MGGLKDGLTGKFAVITGASTPKGLGMAIARRFAAEGASLYLVADGTREQLEAAVADCRELSRAGGRMAWGQYDLGQPDAPDAKALGDFGRIDVLVNNAGIRDNKAFGEFSRAEFDRIVAVNVSAAFFASQAVVPAMRAQGGGRIIHIASQMGSVAYDKRAVYGLTKAALIHLTKSMAYELGKDGIIVNSISPGPPRGITTSIASRICKSCRTRSRSGSVMIWMQPSGAPADSAAGTGNYRYFILQHIGH